MSHPLGMRGVGGLLELAGRYDAFVFDQFGVLHDGTELYPNVATTLASLEQKGKRLLVLTNSGKSERQNLRRIAGLGVPGHVFSGAVTSGDVARQLELPAWVARFGARCHHVSGVDEDVAGIRAALPQIRFVDSPASCDFIYLSGLPDEFDDSRQASLVSQMLELDLPLLCSNPDLVTPRPGRLAISSGTVAQRYRDSGGQVELVGKPHPKIYAALAARLGPDTKAKALLIGDSYHHDIVGAAEAGFDSLLLLGGVHRQLFAGCPDHAAAINVVERSLMVRGIRPSWVSFNV